MTVHRLPLGALLACAAALSATGCVETFSDIAIEDHEPVFAAPILNTAFTLEDALAGTPFDEPLTSDADGGLLLHVSQEIVARTPGDELEIPTILVPITDTAMRFDPAAFGAELPVSRVDLVDGTLTYAFRNDFPEEATVVLRSPDLREDGIPFEAALVVPALSDASGALDFDALTLDLGDGALDLSYVATLATSRTRTRLTVGSLELASRDWSYAEGALEDLTLDLGLDSTDVDFFSEIADGGIELVNPSVTLRVDNEVGAPFLLRSSVAHARLRDGSTRALESPLTEGHVFDYPRDPAGELLRSSSLTFDSSTSNVRELINLYPRNIAVGLEGVANPEQLEETYFIHRDAQLRATLDVEIPLEVQFREFRVEESVGFDGSSLEEAEELAFLLRVSNGFALDATVQFYFYDLDSNLVDSLFARPTTMLEAAEVDQRGATVAPTDKLTEIVVDADRIPNLARTRILRAVLDLTTPRGVGGRTKLYYANELAVQMGARVKVKPDNLRQ